MGTVNLGKSAMTAVVMGIILILSNVARLEAQNNNQQGNQGEDESSLVEQGFAIAPVPLNLAGKNRNLVGLGSYLVNAIGDCNGCHSSGSPSSLFIYPYKAGGNPYFDQPEMLDPTVYLNGGTSFGMVGTPTGPLNYAGPAIIINSCDGIWPVCQILAERSKAGSSTRITHPDCSSGSKGWEAQNGIPGSTHAE